MLEEILVFVLDKEVAGTLWSKLWTGPKENRSSKSTDYIDVRSSWPLITKTNELWIGGFRMKKDLTNSRLDRQNILNNGKRQTMAHWSQPWLSPTIAMMLTSAMTLVCLFAWSFAGSGFTGVSYSFRLWQRRLQIIVFVLRQLLENIDKIFKWIQTVRFCGLYQAEYRCSCLCSRWWFTEQEAFFLYTAYEVLWDLPYRS